MNAGKFGMTRHGRGMTQALSARMAAGFAGKTYQRSSSAFDSFLSGIVKMIDR